MIQLQIKHTISYTFIKYWKFYFENEMEIPFNDDRYQEDNYEDERFSSNNLDLKVYQEDISSKFNNGRF